VSVNLLKALDYPFLEKMVQIIPFMDQLASVFSTVVELPESSTIFFAAGF